MKLGGSAQHKEAMCQLQQNEWCLKNLSPKGLMVYFGNDFEVGPRIQAIQTCGPDGQSQPHWAHSTVTPVYI